MDYLAVFHPLLSFAAHIAEEGERGDGDAPAPGQTAADIDLLVGRALAAEKPGDPAFEAAWFAVAAWVDESFARHAAMQAAGPTDAAEGPGRLQRRYFNTLNAGEEFYANISRLIESIQEDAAKGRFDAGPASGDASERVQAEREALKVYAACLALGFKGEFYRPEDAAEREAFHHRCLAAMDAGSPDGTAKPVSPSLFQAHSGVEPEDKRCGGMWIFCVIPVVATVVLYFLYRAVLSQLYAGTV